MRETLIIFFVILAQLVSAQPTKQNAFCNPLNLEYRYQLDNPSRREAADPTVVWFKDQYFLFASKSGGYWHSQDLINWTFIETNEIPTEDYAPTAIAIGEDMYFLASSAQKSTIYKTTDPLSGKWSIAKEELEKAVWDPAFFVDKDNRLYLFWGIMKPIYGVELDYKNNFSFMGEPKVLIQPNIDKYGWEVTGDYNTFTDKNTFIEGAWVNEHNGKYYLQYATPGTQYKSYADGVYVSENPLGPYTIQVHNPFAYKPEGFINGAGHGSTFQDKWGNFWHIGTMTISVNHRFERRLGMWPAFFDKEGTFYTYTGFGDFPHSFPQKRLTGVEDYQPSLMLLSYNKPVEVSSTLEGHPKENAADENVRSYWSAESGDKGEWLMIDLRNNCKVGAVQINFAEESTTLLGRSDEIYNQYLLEYSTDKSSWKILADITASTKDCPHDYINLQSPVSARYIKLTNHHVPDGKFAVSGLRIFGMGKGKLPMAVNAFTALRDTADARNVTLTWQKSDSASGYNIRYGIAPEKLYQNYKVLGTDSLIIHSLNAGLAYYFTIDVFNENGIRKGKEVTIVGKPSKTNL